MDNNRSFPQLNSLSALYRKWLIYARSLNPLIHHWLEDPPNRGNIQIGIGGGFPLDHLTWVGQ